MTTPSNAVKQKVSPFDMFEEWFKAADSSDPSAEAMTVATADSHGRPSARTLLLKGFSEKGFIFYTNVESRQGREMLENPFVSLLFFWKSLHRQVRIEGHVKEIPSKDTDTYFASRPYLSQIGALASQQSRPLEDREIFLKRVEQLKEQYPEGSVIPRPDYWRGFILEPDAFEFWQDAKFRLHDRVSYTKASDGSWNSSLLYP